MYKEFFWQMTTVCDHQCCVHDPTVSVEVYAFFETQCLDPFSHPFSSTGSGLDCLSSVRVV
jgi:hypothetical protein